MLTTSKKLAETLKIDYLQANSLVKMLSNCGLASRIKTINTIKGKGRPSVEYDIPEGVTIDFKDGSVRSST